MTASQDPLERLGRERLAEPTVRAQFHARLCDLEGQLVRAAQRTADAILPVTTAFLDADHEAAEQWEPRRRQLRVACRDLEEDCYLLLARESPVAGDLRRVVATLRATGDVDRTAGLLGHVATSLTWIDPPSMPGDMRAIVEELGTVVSAIHQDAVRAWRDSDGLAAIDLQRVDDRADRLQRDLLTEIHAGRCSTEEAVTLALVARYYERIGDHGVELARGVTYALTGERLGDA